MTTLYQQSAYTLLFLRRFWSMVLVGVIGTGIPMACVDRIDVALHGSLNVVVVDGTITNLAEPQVIKLYRSTTDPFSGLPGTADLTKASVEVVVDSAQVIPAHETTIGSYQLPSDFRGQVGHAYQLRFTLSDGTRYVSNQEVMVAVPAINALKAQFNPTSLAAQRQEGGAALYPAAHDIFVETQDPVSQTNFYRWNWKLWEKQEWCRTCEQGRYSVNKVVIAVSNNGLRYLNTVDSLFENCYYPPSSLNGEPALRYFVYDYPCRTQCWAILYNNDLNIFADNYTNGGVIAGRRIAQIPYNQYDPCLVEIRQLGLTALAYRFYKQLQDQTQNNGGVADTPPTASIGNVHNVANARESVVGVFTASSVTTARIWLDRRDARSVPPPGLFAALNGRAPSPEPSRPGIPAFDIYNTTAQQPPYSAVCFPTEGQTPNRPEGWQD